MDGWMDLSCCSVLLYLAQPPACARLALISDCRRRLSDRSKSIGGIIMLQHRGSMPPTDSPNSYSDTAALHPLESSSQPRLWPSQCRQALLVRRPYGRPTPRPHAHCPDCATPALQMASLSDGPGGKDLYASGAQPELTAGKGSSLPFSAHLGPRSLCPAIATKARVRRSSLSLPL